MTDTTPEQNPIDVARANRGRREPTDIDRLREERRHRLAGTTPTREDTP